MKAMTAEILRRVKAELPPVRESAPEGRPYHFSHCALRGEGETFEEAFKEWRGKLLCYLDFNRPDWIIWRVEPEAITGTDFATGKALHAVFSRSIIPARAP